MSTSPATAAEATPAERWDPKWVVGLAFPVVAAIIWSLIQMYFSVQAQAKGLEENRTSINALTKERQTGREQELQDLATLKAQVAAQGEDLKEMKADIKTLLRAAR